VSSDAKEELAREAGADHVLRYQGFPHHVRELTGGKGVDVVYDGVGRNTFDGSMSCLRTRGSLVLFGAASGAVAPVDPPATECRRLADADPAVPCALPFSTNRSATGGPGEIFAAAANGNLKVRIGASYPLAEARQAHEDLEGRRTTGKVLLVP
jgi:NADPH2:quinone reductase